MWVCAELLSHVARQDPLFMKFSRQAYSSGLSFPTPGDLPNSEIGAVSFSCVVRQILYHWTTREAQMMVL